MLGFQYDVFLAFSYKDMDFARKLDADLIKQGLRVWFDDRELIPGDLIEQTTFRGIETSQTFAVVVSPNSMESDWVQQLTKRAVALFNQNGTYPRIVPILYRESNVPAEIANFLWVDFRNPSHHEQAVTILVNAVRKMQPKADTMHGEEPQSNQPIDATSLGAEGKVTETGVRPTQPSETYVPKSAIQPPPQEWPTLPPAKQETRHVNLLLFDWPKNGNKQLVPIETPKALAVGRRALIEIYIGALRPGGHSTPKPLSILEPTKTIDLFVTAHSVGNDLIVENPTQVISLPLGSKDSDSAKFYVTPTREASVENPAVLVISVFYFTYLLQEFHFVNEVTSARDLHQPLSDPQDPSRLQFILVADRVPLDVNTKLADIEQRPLDPAQIENIKTRPVSVRISKVHGKYLFNIMTREPEETRDAEERAVPLACYVDLSEGELATSVSQARRRLLDIARDPVYIKEYRDRERDPSKNENGGRCFDFYLKQLAQEGSGLYNRIFNPSLGDSRAAVAKWFRQLQEGSTIQITIEDTAKDFVIPWNLLFDGDPDSDPIDWQHFWGCRYRIEQITDDWQQHLLDAGTEKGWDSTRAQTIAIGDELDLLFGYYGTMPHRQAQVNNWQNYKKNARVSMKIIEVANKNDLIDNLNDCDGEILYFYCHGHAQQFDPGNRIEEQIQDFIDWYEKQTKEVKDLYPDSFLQRLHDDSLNNQTWIELDDGYPIRLDHLMGEPCRLNQYPLVFLNMCQSAMLSPLMRNSFVSFFAEHLARAVIGTECSMSAAYASVFAKDFFDLFLQGSLDLGDVLLKIRRKSMHDYQNPLGLAYSLFGDADVKLDQAVLPRSLGS